MAVEHRFRLLAFDFDGTLMDSQRDIVACMREAFTQFGLNLPEEEAVRQQVGLNLPDIMANLRPDLKREDHFTLSELYRDVYLERRLGNKLEEVLFSDIKSTLSGMQDDEIFMAICTGKKLRGLVPALEHNQIDHFFHSLHTPDNAPGKPNPTMLQQAMEFSATPVDQTVMIGDTTYDMQMAKNAGVTAIGVAWGYHSEQQLVEAGASEVLKSPQQLKEALSSL
jgi:phosphoglycolate phosphatase